MALHFLQETHSSSKDEQKWKDDFKGRLFFSHRKSNSGGVAIGYCGTEAFKVVNTACNKNGRILILDAESIERRIVVFKSLAISKTIHLALVTEISTTNLYENGGLKILTFFQKL